MTLGPTTLAAITWGAVAVVVAVFAYLVVLVAREIADRRRVQG